LYINYLEVSKSYIILLLIIDVIDKNYIIGYYLVNTFLERKLE